MNGLFNVSALDVAIAGRTLCRDLNLRIEPGQCWGILGRNGAGKTTLLHTLAGLRTAERGQIRLKGNDIAQLSRQHIAQSLGLVPQDSHDAFPCTVLETALIGRHPHLGQWAAESPDDFRRAQSALQTVGLRGLETRRIDTLSGGERRRLALATILVQEPDLFLLDEPTNHLDLHHQITLLTHFWNLVKSEQRAVLMSLHDVNLALRFCDHLILLFDNGATIAGPGRECVSKQLLEELYGHPFTELESAMGPVYLPG
jgi:iron complex transport system ATP-binding protein